MVSFALTLDSSYKAVHEILKKVRRNYPHAFCLPLIQLISLDTVNSDSVLKKVALLGEFFRPDELFWPERTRDVSVALNKDAKGKGASDKPDLFLSSLRSKTKTALVFLAEFLFGIKRWRSLLTNVRTVKRKNP